MIDWRLIAVVAVFGWVAWFVKKKEEWVQPIVVAAAMATLVGTLLFLGVPLIR
ncbi:hypothetical protein ACIGNX_19055 [Actinosynnema sp. NPDC053489]|uniref:hypothetical protein n=1 Tax=Actinosynnema sp. NPDC053489 TaxID=3363916 RepID=UPI0037C95668